MFFVESCRHHPQKERTHDMPGHGSLHVSVYVDDDLAKKRGAIVMLYCILFFKDMMHARPY
jgi:hypothetical protein